MRYNIDVYLLSPYPARFAYMRYDGKELWRKKRLEEMKRAREMQFTHVSTGSGRTRIDTAIRKQQLAVIEF